MSMSSCLTVKYAEESQVLTKEEITKDIDFLKRRLASKHFDLDWEGREQVLLSTLDSIAVTYADITTADFFQKIKPVLKTVDDGHTSGFLVQKGDKDKFKRTVKIFSCSNLDSETILLRIPDFYNKAGLTQSLAVFDSLILLPGVSTLIIDLRNNKGGKFSLVGHFLARILVQDTRLCLSLQMRTTIQMLHPLSIVILKLSGFKKTGRYVTREGPILKARHAVDIENKYVLVDSTIISGSMLTVYHLKNAGFTVLGSNPSSLFNTFGNPRPINLPNSHLYVGISTARIFVDENHADRSADMLSCDIQIKEESIEEILEIIRQYESSVK